MKYLIEGMKQTFKYTYKKYKSFRETLDILTDKKSKLNEIEQIELLKKLNQIILDINEGLIKEDKPKY